MTYETFLKRNVSLAGKRPIGVVINLNNGKYLLQLGNESQINNFTGIVKNVMMGKYCIQNPDVFRDRDFTKVKTTNAKEYYDKKKEKEQKEEQSSVKARNNILSYAKTMKKDHVLLFHGSKAGIKGNIDVNYSDQLCDFGSGFYLGDNIDQAENRVSNESNPILYAYDYTLGSCNEFHFSTAVDWALFVGYNRNKVKLNQSIKGLLQMTGYSDMIIGPIADDRMARVFAEFLSGAMTDVALSNCLSYVKYGNQYMLKTQSAVQNLHYVGKYIVTKQMRDASVAVHKKQRESIDAFIEKQKILNSKGKRIFDYL